MIILRSIASILCCSPHNTPLLCLELIVFILRINDKAKLLPIWVGFPLTLYLPPLLNMFFPAVVVFIETYLLAKNWSKADLKTPTTS